MRICGQDFSPDLIGQIQDVITCEPEISRRALSRQVCQWLDWQSDAGDWQEGGCRKALAALNRRELLDLPPTPATVASRRCPEVALEEVDVSTTLVGLGPLVITAIDDYRSDDAKLWRTLIDRHHYLGDKALCGAQLRYLVHSPNYGVVAAMSFNSASWALKARDDHIGWCEAARLANLGRVVTNSRYLIVPGVQVPNLASHLLARISKRLPRDWQARYGIAPVLVETFVDPRYFDGACYRAANWTEVGKTAGRRDGVAKRLFLYGLCPDWQEQLRAAPPTPLRVALPPPEATSWADVEFATLRLHDARLKQRLATVAHDFYNNPQANIPEACGTKARTLGAYRFFQNEKVTMEVILTPHTEASLARIKDHAVVLAPQDTTTLNYYHHPATEGLGPVNNKDNKARGLILHDTLAFSEDGTPLGVIDAQCWARHPEDRGKSERRKQLPIEQKESSKWLRSYRKLAEIQALCPDTLLVSIGDREADLHALFAEAARQPAGPKLLVRAERSRSRRVNSDETLWSYVSAKPVAGELKLHLPKRGNRKARHALLTVRFSEVELKAPKTSALPPVRLWAVHLQENTPEDGGEPIEWMLLTSVPVTSFEHAVQRAEWYAARWGIEVFHRTLKSGCRIKDRQLGTADRLEACLGIDMVVAWRLYHLTMLGRSVPDHPCTAFFDEVEWKTLYCYHHKTTITPDEPPSMKEAIQMLGAMGGHLGRKGDGPPGTQTLWRGIQRLDPAVQMYILFTQAKPPTSWASYPRGYLPPASGP